MKKWHLWLTMTLPLLLMGLCGCQNQQGLASNVSSFSITEDSLMKHASVKETFDNAIRLPSVGGQSEAADPFVLRFDGRYYLYVTTGGPHLRGYVSDDMIVWSPVQADGLSEGYVYEYGKDVTGRHPEKESPWAPEVAYVDGYFYLITSPSGGGHYVLRSERPEGPFRLLSENIGASIDGDFFLDDDENIYVLTADSTSIVIRRLNEEKTAFVPFEGTEVNANSLLPLRLGGWNEGPYVLRRSGALYATYTGTHFLSPTYRVDYAYAPKGKSIAKSSSYTREDTVLLSTENDYMGLGHSSTVLGPDLDSYYIVYHNIEKNKSRFLNLARLSFNGPEMVACDYGKTDNFMPTKCAFASREKEGLSEENGILLSPAYDGDAFSLEASLLDESKIFFAYQNNRDYAYLKSDFASRKISLFQVNGGQEALLKEVPLNHDFSSSVLHSYRLSYKKGFLDFYFDGMEKLALEPLFIKPGRAGVEKDAACSFLAYHDVGLGSSDGREYHSKRFLANGYDEALHSANAQTLVGAQKGAYRFDGASYLSLKQKGEWVSYRIYEKESGSYALDLRIPSSSLGKKIGIRIDDDPLQKIVIPNNIALAKTGDSLVNVANLRLASGPHNLSFWNLGEEVSFLEGFLRKEASETSLNVAFDASFKGDYFTVRNFLYPSENGLASRSQASFGLISEEHCTNMNVETSFAVASFEGGSVGVLLNVTDYGKNAIDDADGSDNSSSYRGYEFLVDGVSAELRYVDYNFSQSLKIVDYPISPNQRTALSIRQENNVYVCSINGKVLFSIVSNIGNLQGHFGLWSEKADVRFFSIKAN